MRYDEINTDDLAAAFSSVLRELRQKHGLTQERLAELSHVDRTYISYLERGTRQPTLKILIQLARGLEMSTAELVSGVEAALTQKEDS